MPNEAKLEARIIHWEQDSISKNFYFGFLPGEKVCSFHIQRLTQGPNEQLNGKFLLSSATGRGNLRATNFDDLESAKAHAEQLKVQKSTPQLTLLLSQTEIKLLTY